MKRLKADLCEVDAAAPPASVRQINDEVIVATSQSATRRRWESERCAMNAESRKSALRYFFEKVVEPLGFKFTPDAELKEFLLDQEVILEAKHGTPSVLVSHYARTRARHEDGLPVHSVPSGAFRCDQTLLVRTLRAQGRSRPEHVAATGAEGRALSDKFVRAIAADEIAPGGMKTSSSTEMKSSYATVVEPTTPSNGAAAT